MGYFRLGYIVLGDFHTGLGNWPRRVTAPVGARNRRKATVKNTKNGPLWRDVVERTIPKMFSRQISSFH